MASKIIKHGLATGPFPESFWKRNRSPGGLEWVNYPSPLARQLWLYVRAIGRARHAPGFRGTHRDEDGYLLHFVQRGQLWHRIRERTCIARPGDACLMDFSDDIEYANKATGQVEFYWVLFNGKDMARAFAELRADQEPLFPQLDAARMASLFRELMAITAHPPLAYEPKASASLTLLLAELFAQRMPKVSFAEVSGQGRPLSDAVRKGIDYMTRYYDQQISIRNAAIIVGQSMFHFARVFRRETGFAPMEYLNRHRVEQAKRLLEASSKSIEQISRSVGFPDPNYFSKIFARFTGTSPRQFRNQIQNGSLTRAKTGISKRS